MSLWGADFTPIKVNKPEKTKKVVDKIKQPKSVNTAKLRSVKSSSVDIKQQLENIKNEVYRILGKYADDTITIRNKEDLHTYIDKAIENGIISIDTETNNSLDPITCLLMGPCIYTPGMKSAYIPIHHVDPFTRELLENQLTEEDINEEFSRLSSTNIIMHNGKFDYQVIKCTCDLQLTIYWDTMIAAQILDENEPAALKKQYIMHIDSDQEKYDIEHLFEGLEYAIVDPDVFALYAATDAYITYKLYLYQKEQFELPGNDRLYNVFKGIEMPVIEVAAEMELYGVAIDNEYSKRLSNKYHKILDEVDAEIGVELDKLADVITNWRLTKEANYKEQTTNRKGEATYKKSKNEQLASPPEVTSPTQLAILLYDILQTPVVDKKSPRGTGEDILNQINQPLCKIILKKRGIEKLIGTYIDKIPSCVNSYDNRLHCKFNQTGAKTGRFSSSDPNLQNIPSHVKSIRLMFIPERGDVQVSIKHNKLVLNTTDEVFTTVGYVKATALTKENILVDKETNITYNIENIKTDKYNVTINISNNIGA